MSNGYETLVNTSKSFLSNNEQITENDITYAVNTVSPMLKKRYDLIPKFEEHGGRIPSKQGKKKERTITGIHIKIIC